MNHWQPDEIWHPAAVEAYGDPALECTVSSFNRQPYHELVRDLESRVESVSPASDDDPSAYTFAVLDGTTSESSDTEALVTFNPHANGASPNMLLRAEFIRRYLDHCGVRDETGRPLPVIMVAGPTPEYDMAFKPHHIEQIASGDFSGVGERMLIPVKRRNFGRIALAGFSQGADIAAAAAGRAYANGFDAKTLSVGDPAGVLDRSRPLQLGVAFARSAPSLKPNVMSGGVEATIIAQGWHESIKPGHVEALDFARNALMRSNRVLRRGLAKDGFWQSLQTAVANGNIDSIVVAWGGNSTITPPGVMREVLSQDAFESVHTIEVAGAQHGWGDNLPLLARLYTRTLIT